MKPTRRIRIIIAVGFLLIGCCLIAAIVTQNREPTVLALRVVVSRDATNQVAYCEIPHPNPWPQQRFLRFFTLGHMTRIEPRLLTRTNGDWHRHWTFSPSDTNGGMGFSTPIPTNETWKIQIIDTKRQALRFGDRSILLPFDIKTIVFESQTFSAGAGL